MVYSLYQSAGPASRSSLLARKKWKVTNSNTSRMRRDAPRSPIAPIIHDVVTHLKFRGDPFGGFAPSGSRISHFSYT